MELIYTFQNSKFLKGINPSIPLSYFEKLSYKTNQYLLKEKKRLDYIYYIESGCVVYHTSDLKDLKVVEMFFETDWITLYHSELQKTMSIQFMEDAIVWRISRSKLKALCKEIPRASEFIMDKYEWYLFKNTQRLIDLISRTAGERYKKLLKENPSALLRIPNYMIASYLGVTPQSLSRLKRA